MNAASVYRRTRASIAGLSSRERMILILAFTVLLFIAGQSALDMVQESIDSTRHLVQARSQQLRDLDRVLSRYLSLVERRDSLQETFAHSQMSFEQVTNELDRIVRAAIASDNYELKKPNPPKPFGFEYEKQDFSLIVKSLTLQQLVTLLHEIEHGSRPIFLSKVDITKSATGIDFGAVLEIYSIAKAAPKAETGA